MSLDSTCPQDETLQRCQAIRQQGHQPEISDYGAGTRGEGQEKWYGPKIRSTIWQSPESLSPGHLFAASEGAKGYNPKFDANKLICQVEKKKGQRANVF